MPAAVISAFLLFTCITAFTPGPNNILLFGATSRYGLRQSVPVIVGVWTGLWCVIILCGAASFSVSLLSENFVTGMRFVGFLYIVWLAWKVATAPPVAEDGKSSGTGFWGGFILQFVNIKIIIYGLTAFSGYVLPYYDSVLWVMAFAMILGVIGNAGNLTWALAGSALRRFLQQYGRVTNIVMGVLLLACAVGLLF